LGETAIGQLITQRSQVRILSGTTSVAHLGENVAATDSALSDDEVGTLSASRTR